MKTAVSLPDPLFRRAEKVAARLGLSRSGLYRRALEAYLEGHRQMRVSEALDAVYETSPESGSLDPAIEQLQEASLPDEEW